MWTKHGLNYYICFMATINYFIQSKNNPAGIYVRLRDGRDIDAKAKTKFAINPDDWSAVKGQPKNLKDTSFKKLHNELIKSSTELLNHFNNSINKNPINTQWLKDFINPTQQTGSIPTKLIDYFDYYSLHKESTIETSTHKKLKVNKHLLERFQKETQKEYFIKDVNLDFKLHFEDYCKKQKYATNTIARAIKFIKTICYHARNNGIETHFQLDNISVKLQKIDKIYLTIDELEKIEKIEFSQIKTGKTMAIPLSKKVMTILKKRKGEFPRQISDQKYNEYIKDVCKLAEINQMVKGSKAKTEGKITRKDNGTFEKWELVTSHIGRRSFATNNYGRIPTSLLINVTGHSTETMFLEYIGKTVTEKAIELAKYF